MAFGLNSYTISPSQIWGYFRKGKKMKAKSGIAIAIIIILLSITEVSYSSIENPVTREEFEQKVQQQQAKIKELETLVAEQKKQILDLKWEIYHLKYGADPNKTEQPRDKVVENKKLQTIIENQKTEITELRAKLKRVTSKLQQATAKVAPAKAKGTKKTKNKRFNVANGNEEITEVRKPARRVLKRINLNKTGKGPPIFQKGIDENYIRIGPGMEYENDDTGALFEDDKLYVLEEKNDWIRFRVTEKDLGWSAWIRKNLTDSFSLSPVKERAKRIAKFGEPPQNSAWDGSVRCVKDYLKAVAKDPDSLRYENWSKPYYSEDGWLVKCDYRAKNSFGGYVREVKWFIIRHGIVVDVKDFDTYKISP